MARDPRNASRRTATSGIAFYKTGMLEEAMREFRRVTDLRPGDELREVLHRSHADAERTDGPMRRMRCMRPQLPSREGAVFHNLAYALERLGRYDDAREALEQAQNRGLTRRPSRADVDRDGRAATGRRGQRGPHAQRCARAVRTEETDGRMVSRRVTGRVTAGTSRTRCRDSCRRDRRASAARRCCRTISLSCTSGSGAPTMRWHVRSAGSSSTRIFRSCTRIVVTSRTRRDARWKRWSRISGP